MTVSATTEQQAFQSVKRACYAGLDSVTLRVEIARRVERVVPCDTSYFWTLDPETGLVSHGVAQHVSPRIFAEFVGHHYPDDEATQVIDQARAGSILKFGCAPELRELLVSEGIHQDVRALFFTPEAYWGSWCILRGHAPAFADRETRFLERIAPHVAEGLKSAALLELSAAAGELVEEADADLASPATTPGFVVLAPNAEVMLRTPAVAPYLGDLSIDGVADDGQVPYPVLSVRGRLLRARCTPDQAPADARLRARGRSGTWYSLRATSAEPDASGRSSVLVSIEPSARREVAPLLFRLYGLSPHEREVLLWVIRGEPTKGIAAQLGLSMHTVQDYLDKACEKVGVRGRKALVAKLFQDGFAPGLMA